MQPVVAPAAKKPVTTAPAKVDSGLAPKRKFLFVPFVCGGSDGGCYAI